MRALCLMLAMLLGGCAANKPTPPPDPREGDVKGREIRDEAAEAYPVAKAGEGYFGPFPFEENAAPQYPADQLARNLPPVIVRARIIVDEGGNVTRCLPLLNTAEDAPEFFAAVHAALFAWRFDPLVKMEGGPGRTTIRYHGVQRHFEGKAIALPFHQDYEFTFTQRDGKGTVSSSTGQ